MKTIKAVIAVALLCIVSFHAKSQILQCGPECLGVWCSVDVDLSSSQSYSASYPIPHTPEKFGPMQYNNGYPMYSDPTSVTCYGPGNPYITILGGEAELHLNLRNLEIEANMIAEQQGNNSDYVEIMVDFPVQKQFVQFDGCKYQCHYHIRLVVKLK